MSKWLIYFILTTKIYILRILLSWACIDNFVFMVNTKYLGFFNLYIKDGQKYNKKCEVYIHDLNSRLTNVVSIFQHLSRLLIIGCFISCWIMGMLIKVSFVIPICMTIVIPKWTHGWIHLMGLYWIRCLGWMKLMMWMF